MRKNRQNNYFSVRTKLEELRYHMKIEGFGRFYADFLTIITFSEIETT